MTISSKIETPVAGAKIQSGAPKSSLLPILAPVLLMSVAAFFVFFADLGKYPLFNPDEAYYAEPAREMLDTGEYITTLLNYVVRFTKPPLVIWAMAGSYQLFGPNEFAARFFGAACGAVLTIITFLFARKYVNQRAGVIAGSILLTSPLFIGVGRESIADMPLSLFVAGSLMSFYHSYAQKLARWRWIGYALIGLAIMTKGPVGLVLPVAILLAFHAVRRDLRQAIAYYKPLPGLLLTALIGLPWFVIEIYKTHGGYYNEFIVRENFKRFTSVVDHKGPWWYHIAAILGGLFPWSLFLPAACVTTATASGATAAVVGNDPIVSGENSADTVKPSGSARRWFNRLTHQVAGYKNLAPRESAVLFCGITAAVIVAFFSASVSKLFSYTVPAFPALAIVIANYLDRLIDRKNVRPVAIVSAVCAVVFGAGLAIAPHALKHLRDCPAALLHLVPTALTVLGAAMLIAMLAAITRHLKVAVATIAVTMLIGLLVVGSQALDIFSNDWEMPVKAYAQFAAGSNWPIIVFNQRKFSVMFYAHRKTLLLDTKEQLEQALQENPHAYIITHTRDEEVVSSLGCKIVAKHGKSLLASWSADRNNAR